MRTRRFVDTRASRLLYDLWSLFIVSAVAFTAAFFAGWLALWAWTTIINLHLLGKV